MSSSDETSHPRYSGRVLLGCDTPGAGFITIQDIERGGAGPLWDAATEEEYIDRCKGKAEELARDIVAKALAKAHDEAKAIRAGAQAEVAQAVAKAHDEALAQAQAQLDAEFQSQAKTMLGLVSRLQEFGKDVWAARRKDFAALAKLFIKKALGVEMASRRAEILEKLMDEACSKLEAHRDFTLKVAAQDFEAAKALLDEIKAARPDLGNWSVVVDPALAKGGVVLETEEMLADDGVESRLALLAPYLDQLGLPEDVEKARAPEPAAEAKTLGDAAAAPKAAHGA